MEKKIDLNKLSFEDLQKKIKEIEQQKVNVVNKEYGWELGKNYLVRTVTHIQVGKLEHINDKELFMSSASWVADTGRFNDMLTDGLESIEASEIEPFINIVGVNRGAIIDFVEYSHELPNKKK